MFPPTFSRPDSSPTERQLSACLRLVKRRLKELRQGHASLKVHREGRTRYGWAVVFQTASGPQQALEFDAKTGKQRIVSPEWVFENWLSP